MSTSRHSHSPAPSKGTGWRSPVQLPVEDRVEAAQPIARPLANFFESGWYDFSRICGFDAPSLQLANEWDLPSGVLPIEGDGHTFLALDYRSDRSQPRVVLVESEGHQVLVVASTFEDFVVKIRRYEDVFDPDGDIIAEDQADSRDAP
jgi:hypothetical protein